MPGRSYYLTTRTDWKRHAARLAQSHYVAANPAAPVTDSSPILALIEADEGVHLELENDPGFRPLPHPLSNRPVAEFIAAQLVGHGVAPGATTFDVAEAVGKSHPLLRHRVF